LTPIASATSPLTVNALRNLNSNQIQADVGSMIVNARKENQDSNILANPRIRVRNKDKAKILIGDRVPVMTTTSTSTGFVSESINYVDVGLKLEVEPDIYLDEEVSIKINLEVSSLVREVTSKTGSLAYQIGTRGASTVLRLKNGETQVLAGLISDEERSTGNKLPGLGDLPIVGRLFGSQKDDDQRSEIVLAITPHVVRANRRSGLLLAEFDSGTANSIGAPPLRLMASTEAPKGKSTAPATAGASGQASPAGTATPIASQTTSQTTTTPTPDGAQSAATVTPIPAPSSASAGSALNLSWQAPAEIKAGEQFSVILRLSSQDALRGLPLLIGYDPQLLQVASVQEGEFFKQGNAQSNFSQRIDPAQGKIFVAAIRQNTGGADNGINGAGTVAILTFKAIKAGTARLQLLSATPEPARPVTAPPEQMIKIAP
jgi:general secretion pathway protein D